MGVVSHFKCLETVVNKNEDFICFICHGLLNSEEIQGVEQQYAKIQVVHESGVENNVSVSNMNIEDDVENNNNDLESFVDETEASETQVISAKNIEGIVTGSELKSSTEKSNMEYNSIAKVSMNILMPCDITSKSKDIEVDVVSQNQFESSPVGFHQIESNVVKVGDISTIAEEI